MADFTLDGDERNCYSGHLAPWSLFVGWPMMSRINYDLYDTCALEIDDDQFSQGWTVRGWEGFVFDVLFVTVTCVFAFRSFTLWYVADFGGNE